MKMTQITDRNRPYRGEILYNPRADKVGICTSWGKMRYLGGRNSSTVFRVPTDGVWFRTGNTTRSLSYSMCEMYKRKAVDQKITVPF